MAEIQSAHDSDGAWPNALSTQLSQAPFSSNPVSIQAGNALQAESQRLAPKGKAVQNLHASERSVVFPAFSVFGGALSRANRGRSELSLGTANGPEDISDNSGGRRNPDTNPAASTAAKDASSSKWQSHSRAPTTRPETKFPVPHNAHAMGEERSRSSSGRSALAIEGIQVDNARYVNGDHGSRSGESYGTGVFITGLSREMRVPNAHSIPNDAVRRGDSLSGVSDGARHVGNTHLEGQVAAFLTLNIANTLGFQDLPVHRLITS
jgi:hypothetical protein